MSKKEWLLTALMCLLVAGASVAYVKWPRTVPFEQCSEVYQRYANHPGIQASFIKDKYINDSVSLDVTLIKATDSSAFMQLLIEMNKPEDLIKIIATTPVEKDKRYTSLHPKGHPELPMDPVKMNNDVVVVFPAVRSVAVFHITQEDQYKLILLGNIRKTLNI